MSNMELGKDGISLIQYYEGVKLKAYKCPAGIWTIGYGHTGPDVKPGLVITTEKANALFSEDIAKFVAAVNTYLTVDVTQNLFDALVSFAFNLGEGSLKRSTLLKYVNQKKTYTDISSQFRRYVYGNGVKLVGLVKRREAEALLAGGFPWRTASTKSSSVEVYQTTNVSVEPEWTHKEEDHVIVNPTNIGSSVAIIGATVNSIISNADTIASSTKSTAQELGTYTEYVPQVKYGISTLMVISLILVIVNKVRKVIESRK